MTGEEEKAKPKKLWQRVALAVIAVLGAFGIFSAIGGNIVDEIFPSVSEQLTGAGLIRVDVRPADDGSDGFNVATWSDDGVAERLDGVEDCVSLLATARSVGGVDIGRSYRNLVFEGTTHRDVAIVDLRAEIVRRSAPMDGSRISCPSGGTVAPIGFSYDFDRPQPTALRSDLPGEEEPFFERGNIILLKKGELQPVQMMATVSHDYVAWRIVADLLVDGKEESVTIDDGGKPFQITAGDPEPRFDRYYAWESFEYPPRLAVSTEPPE